MGKAGFLGRAGPPFPSQTFRLTKYILMYILANRGNDYGIGIRSRESARAGREMG
jgi:hypothetical protein